LGMLAAGDNQMKTAYCSLVLSITLLSLCVASEEPRVENLITVTLMGTDIDQFPHYIHVFANDPKAAAQESTARINSRDHAFMNMFMAQGGRAFGYYKPEDWHYEGIDLIPVVGDVIYIFRFSDASSMKSFSKKYELKQIQKGKDSKLCLYKASEHYYVITEVATSIYTCSMHPKIKSPKPGKCPICFMDLIELQE
jgi:hypothetical protein